MATHDININRLQKEFFFIKRVETILIPSLKLMNITTQALIARLLKI